MLKELEILLMKVRIGRMEKKKPPLYMAKLFFYESEAFSLKPIFLDHDCYVPSENPVIADADGEFPDVFFSAYDIKPYRIELQDHRGVALLHKDYINEA